MTIVTKEQIEELLAQDDVTAVPSFGNTGDHEEWSRAVLRLALEAISAQWKPIESAPKDGTSILVASRLSPWPPFVEIAKWDPQLALWVSWYGTQIVQPYQWTAKPLAG